MLTSTSKKRVLFFCTFFFVKRSIVLEKEHSMKIGFTQVDCNLLKEDKSNKRIIYKNFDWNKFYEDYDNNHKINNWVDLVKQCSYLCRNEFLNC